MCRPSRLTSAAALLVLLLYPVLVRGQATPSLDIHYVPTPDEVVDAMLETAHVTAGDLVYDLGSGDGRIVIEAARRFGARGVGVELDPALVRQARANAKKAGVDKLVSFRQADLFKTDLSSATVVTLYLSPSINLRLRSRLQELRPGTRIVSHRFTIEGWPADEEKIIGQHPEPGVGHLFFWTIRR